MTSAVAIILALLLVCVLLLVMFQGSLIYYPQPVVEANRRRLAGYEVNVSRQGTTLRGWYVPGEVSDERPLVVYYGGNGEEVSHTVGELLRLDVGAVLAFNYRGYGASEGRPSERRILGDAVAILDEFTARGGTPLSRVVLIGRSLGSGVAVHVASRRRVRGVILVTPFDSLVGVARLHFRWLPVGLLLRQRYESIALAPRMDTPALFLIAGEDRLIPPALGHRLAAAWRGPGRTTVVAGAGHNDIQMHETYWAAVAAFLEGR